MPSVAELLFAAPGALLLAFALLPIGRLKLRCWLAPHIEAIVRSQVLLVLWIQDTLHCTVMDVLCTITEFSVSIEFYISVLPGFIFLGYPIEVTQATAGLASITYVSCLLKDLFSGPRPGHVALPDQMSRLNMHELMKDYNKEYGLPSMHTSAGLFIALLAVHYFVGPELSIWHAAAVGWGLWICVTRLYFGVHSFIDLAAGLVVAVSWFGLWRIAYVPYTTYMVGTDVLATGAVANTVPGVMLQRLAIHTLVHTWALSGAYTRPWHATESYVFAVTFVGAWSGLVLPHGISIPRLQPHRIADYLPPQLVSLLAAALQDQPRHLQLLARVVGGLLVCLPLRPLVKALLTPVMREVFNALPDGIRARMQPPVSDRCLEAGRWMGCGCDGTSGEVKQAPAGSQAPPGSQDPLKQRQQQQQGRAQSRTPAVVTAEAVSADDGADSKGSTNTSTSGSSGRGSEQAAASKPRYPSFVLLRPDGYPWDADTARRYLTYCAVVTFVYVYHFTVPLPA